jgi:hypothetical protein
MLCMVVKVSRLSTEEMRRVSDFKLKWKEEGFQTCFVSIPKCTRPLHAWRQWQHPSPCVGRRFSFQLERFVCHDLRI